jgi:hypothetical protein
MLCSELLRSEVGETRMGTFAIIGDAPAFDLAASVVERQEEVFIETLAFAPKIPTI